jgi:hypothetical protein
MSAQRGELCGEVKGIALWLPVSHAAPVDLFYR